MAYADETLTRLFASTPYWQLGLYWSGQDPMVDLYAAETTGATYFRATLSSWSTPADTNPSSIHCASDVTVAGIPAGDVAGYFVIAPGATTPLFKVAFTAPVTVERGDLITITGSDISIALGLA